MNHFSIVSDHFDEHLQVASKTYESLTDSILKASHLISSSLSSGGTLLLCGNGGSAADCQHLSAELVGRFKTNRQPLRSIALTTDSSILTCVGNDFGYEYIFSRQITALATDRDILLSISSSGVSQSIVEALKTSKKIGLKTIALLGKDGGPAAKLADLPIIIPSLSTARIQEMHIFIGHILCDLIEKELNLV